MKISERKEKEREREERKKEGRKIVHVLDECIDYNFLYFIVQINRS